MLGWDRIKGSFFALVGATDPRAQYAGIYGATVKSVSPSSMTADVQLDDAIVPGMSGLSLQVGLPGATVDFVAGAHVRVAFENRDPAKAFIIGWAPGAVASRVSLPAGKVELGAEGLVPVVDGVVTGRAIDSLYGIPMWQLDNSSAVVAAKK